MHQYELRRLLSTCIQIWCDRTLVYFHRGLAATANTNFKIFPQIHIWKAYYVSSLIAELSEGMHFFSALSKNENLSNRRRRWRRNDLKKKKLCLPIHVWIASRKCTMLVVGGSSTCVPARRTRMYFLFSVWRFFFHLLRFWFRLWKTNLFISKRM